MQTPNSIEHNFSKFNALRLFEASTLENNKRGLALLEQLQTTLEVEQLLNMFALEAAKYIDFSGLYFKYGSIRKAIRGSKQGKSERQFELKINNDFIGVITYAINSPISLANMKILNELHQYLLYPMRNAIHYHEAMQLARQDSLTGLGNRRYFDEQLKRAMHNANRQHTRVGLMLCDLNKFKEINDTYGHKVGDDVLTHFAKALISCVRDSDSVFRFGGDEFAILVEHASDNSLAIIDARLKRALNNDALLAKYNVTSALGACFMNRVDNEHSFFERVDQALYRHKMNVPRTLSLV